MGAVVSDTPDTPPAPARTTLNTYITGAVLYAGIALLTPVSSILTEAAAQGAWPQSMELVAAAVAGLLAALVSLKAYTSGTAEKYRQGKEQ